MNEIRPALEHALSDSQQNDPRQRIQELEQQIEELVKQLEDLQNTVIDWHSAMFGALNLILKPHRFNLILEREYLLNVMPRRIDCIVLKKDETIPIDLDAFRLFRKHNIIEFKSYLDELNIDVIWNTISYAMQFMSQEERTEDIPVDTVTITIIRSAYPQALFKQISQLNGLGLTIEEKYHNIFYVKGFIIPIQIVVAKELDDEYLPLLVLTGRARESDIRKFLKYRENLTDKSDRKFADAVAWASAEANKDTYAKLKEENEMRMTGALRDIMQDEISAAESKGAADAFQIVAERLISNGTDGTTIAVATGYDRDYIDSIATAMKRTVSW